MSVSAEQLTSYPTQPSEAAAREPIAIIGMACRLPGHVMDPDGLWRLLCEGVNPITEVPADRWQVRAFCNPDPSRPGKITSRWGGYVDNLDQFDADFFGISPREASRIDPQHRWLLETAYEAIEDAGQAPERLAGSSTGVFIGISTCDYGGIQCSPTERHTIDAYTNIGLGICIAANRISHQFDFHGPSVSVDTACSSSLVAVHLACQAIWNGDCRLAMVGGVNALIRPEGNIGFSKASMLAADGQCKSFDERANGYVRSEGAGVVFLKPLSQAVHDGDRVHAVIRGTLINQDGRTPGMALPNGVAQASMLAEVYRKAGIDPTHVHYVEAHGTGTPAGDPIELKAIGSVFGAGRAAGDECVVGSIKSNIGHPEAASGIAGLIKATLCVKHGMIPPNLHFTVPNPNIPFADLRLRVPQSLEPWPLNGTPTRIAGVNSFGFGGTNAHVVVESAPPAKPEAAAAADDDVLVLPISARSQEALEAAAKSYAAYLSGDGAGIPLTDICYNAAVRRGHSDHRLTLVGRSHKEMVEQLEAFTAGEMRLATSTGKRVASRGSKLAFVFSGMGPQWWAMGRQLLVEEPVFRDVVLEIDALLRPLAGWSLVDELTADEDVSRINQTHIAQPAIFAVQAGLAALWRSWGVTPDAVVGHSVGEVAAAYVSGALTLPEAVTLVYHRSRLQRQTAGQGEMLAVGLTATEAEGLIAPYGSRLSVAAINSPGDVTLSGDAAALVEIKAALDEKQAFCRPLQVEVPYHSFRMDPLKDELLRSLASLNPGPTQVPMFSTVTGQAIEGHELTPEYWWRNVRHSVLFSSAVDELARQGHQLFLEVSAQPVLAGAVAKCLSAIKKEGSVVTSLRRSEPEPTMMRASLGKLYTLGFPVDWSLQYRERRPFVRLPSYPWQRERHWHESDETRAERTGAQVHPLLGRPQKTPDPTWSVELDRHALGYLGDHRVQDAVVFPAAAYVEMALAAGRELFGAGPCVVEELSLQRGIVLSNDAVPVQFVRDAGQPSFSIYSQTKGSEQQWVRHATGKLRRRQDGELPGQVAVAEIAARCTMDVAKTEFYRTFEKAGLQYGPLFQGIETLRCGKNEALGLVRLHADLEAEAADYLLHPTILDASFHALLGAIAMTALDRANDAQVVEGVYLPVRIERVRFFGRSFKSATVHARLVDHGSSSFTGDIALLDDDGNVLADIQGFQCRAIERPSERIDSYLYQYQWKLQARPGQAFGLRAADYIPAPSEMAARLQTEGDRLRREFELDRYHSLEPQVRALANGYLLAAFEQLGWAGRLEAAAVIERLGIVEQHRRLVGRMLEILVQDGAVIRDGDMLEIRRRDDESDPEGNWRSLWYMFPGLQAELMLVRQCGERLADVLTGKLDPLEAIFPQGSLTIAEHLYQDAPSYRIYNLLAQKAVAAALERLPEGRTIRVLEIGGGTGGMTTYVLRKMPPDRTEYVFSDVTQLLTGHAEQKFRDFSFVQYKLLDIETDPVAQGYEPHSFDLVLASDVLHATRDLRETLGHVKQLLAPKGLLVLLELTNTPRWVVLVFGLLRGWWKFTDTDLRPADPWITQEKWKAVLRDVGFTDVACIADTSVGEEALHSVVLAQGPMVVDPPPASRQDEPATPEAAAPAGAATETPAPDKRGTWLIFADVGGTGAQLAQRFLVAGHRPVLVYPGESFQMLAPDNYEIDPSSADQTRQFIDQALAGGTECRGVVHLWSLDTPPPDETSPASLDAAHVRGCFSALKVTQVLSKVEWTGVPRLWLVTSGAESVGSSPHPVAVAQSPMWGLSRTITNEHPNLRSTTVDLSASPDAREIQSLYDELIADDREDEVVLREQARYVHRLMRISLAKIQEQSQAVGPAVSSQPFALEIPTPGILDNLTLRARERRAPGAGEVEIQVRAASLNFKDVMLAMGLLPDEALEGGYTGRELGMECSGTISAVGPGVAHLAIGDAVITSGPGALCSHMIMGAHSVALKPAQITFEEATTIPIAFSTAYYALHHVARLQRGERVLIHAAAGGVGLAALQLAQRIGAEVFATAGTQVKRDLLRALGVRHVMDSRSLAFADDIMQATGGEGVDVVLNSLAGDAIAKSFAVLRPYGRFVEIGKRDVYENNRIELRPFRNNLSYFAVDLDKLCAQRPEFVRSLMKETMEEFGDGSLRPLSYRMFAIEDIANAFRYMAQGKHIGKVVISLPESDVVVAPPQRTGVELRGDGTYLITGGLGGFGIALAEWMVERGARHLALCGRRTPSPEAAVAIEAMTAAGASVRVFSVDVTREDDVVTLLSEVETSMPPLRGVVHGAMVLDDDLLHQLDDARMRRAMDPKATGAWLLHAHTSHLPLDLFVMFSSFSSIIGTTRQGNYVAANAFLDALAHHRHARGLPALTVNWGVVGGVGYVAHTADLGQKLDQFGFKSLPVQQMLGIFGALLQEKAVQIGIGYMNWQQLAKMHMIGGSPRYAYLVKPVLTDDVGGAGAWLIDALMAVEPSERQKFLEGHIREQLARVLGTSPSKVDVDKPLISLGLDSLMAVEIGNRMQSELGVSIPPVKFMEGLTTAGMAQYLVEQLSSDRAGAPASSLRDIKPGLMALRGGEEPLHAPAPPDVDQVLVAVNNLSDREVDTLLKRIETEETVSEEEEEAV